MSPPSIEIEYEIKNNAVWWVLGIGVTLFSVAALITPFRTVMIPGIVMFVFSLTVYGYQLWKYSRTGTGHVVIDIFWKSISERHKLKALVILFGLSLAGSGFFALLATVLNKLGEYTRNPANADSATVAIGVFAILVLGSAAFYLRLKLRTFYGVLESLAGLAFAWAHLSIKGGKTEINTVTAIAFLLSGIYVVVRGFDNIHQGYVAEKPDKFARLFGAKGKPPCVRKEKNA